MGDMLEELPGPYLMCSVKIRHLSRRGNRENRPMDNAALP
jgi:hypothetical protein